MKRILLALALLAPALAGAQDLSHPWTLQECLDWALGHNLTVKQSELNVAQREIQLNTSKNAYYPNVSGSANESVNFGIPLPTTRRSSSLACEARMMSPSLS